MQLNTVLLCYKTSYKQYTSVLGVGRISSFNFLGFEEARWGKWQNGEISFVFLDSVHVNTLIRLKMERELRTVRK